MELAIDEDSNAKVASNANAEQDLIVDKLKDEGGSSRNTSANR